MRIGFSVVMLFLVILFYISDPKNKVNKWCTISGIFFWIGVTKQAVMFEVIPVLSILLESPMLAEQFVPIHSMCTWVIYTLAVPTLAVAVLYFGYINEKYPKHILRMLQCAIYIPGFVLLFFFAPWRFGEYQQTSHLFWIVYAIYNFGFAFIITFLAIKGIREEKNRHSSNQMNHRKQVAIILLPPLFYWLISIFAVRVLDALLIDLTSVYEFWLGNIIIVLICIIYFIFSAFKDGFMGLKLIKQHSYDWDASMKMVNIGAAYNNHFLKSQTPLMEMYIDDLKEHFITLDSSKKLPKEFDDLSNSLGCLKNFFDRIIYHSQDIILKEEYVNIADMLKVAIHVSQLDSAGIKTHIQLDENLVLMCDRSHMTEVIVNILKNASEAIRDHGEIIITGIDNEPKSYCLEFKDNGAGIDSDMIKRIFDPYVSTKNKEKNFGLGLTYCKNVVEKHGGSITVKSVMNTGTTTTIALPCGRVNRKGDYKNA